MDKNIKDLRKAVTAAEKIFPAAEWREPLRKYMDNREIIGGGCMEVWLQAQCADFEEAFHLLKQLEATK